MRYILILLAMILNLNACYTMHFTKAGAEPSEYTYSKWHHIGLAGLVEFSEPVNLNHYCRESNWQAVRVQTGFLQGLVKWIGIPFGEETYHSELLDEEIPLGTPVSLFYSPEEVSITCSEP